MDQLQSQAHRRAEEDALARAQAEATAQAEAGIWTVATDGTVEETWRNCPDLLSDLGDFEMMSSFW